MNNNNHLKSTTCLNSGLAENSPPIAESVSDCGELVLGCDRVGDTGEMVVLLLVDMVAVVSGVECGAVSM